MFVQVKTSDVWTIINALRAAADVYTTDGEKCTHAGDHRTAMQFHAQAHTARELAAELEAK